MSARYLRPVYADKSNLPENLQSLPDADARIQAASDIVAWLIKGARYNTDDDGHPTDENLRTLLKEATVTQAVFADDKYGGADTPGDGAPAQLGSLKFDSDTSGRNPNYGTGIRQNMSPAAWYMLRNAGLIHGQVK